MSCEEPDIYNLTTIIDISSKDELLKMKNLLQDAYNKFVIYKEQEVSFQENLWKTNLEENKLDLEVLKIEADPYIVCLSIAARRLGVIKGEKLLDIKNT